VPGWLFGRRGLAFRLDFNEKLAPIPELDVKINEVPMWAVIRLANVWDHDLLR